MSKKKKVNISEKLNVGGLESATESLLRKLSVSQVHKNFGLPTGLQQMVSQMNRIQDAFYPPGIRAIVDMQNRMKDIYRPTVAIADMAIGMQQRFNPVSHQMQEALTMANNSGLVNIANSLRSVSDQLQESIKIQAFQGPALFPNIATDLFNKGYWKDFTEEDETINEVAEILEDVQESGIPTESTLDKLIQVVEKSVLEQEKTNELLAESGEREASKKNLEKAHLLIAILVLILTAYGVFSSQKQDTEKESENKVLEEKVDKLSILLETLVEQTKETTANVNLRKEPNTKSKENIILTIPEGEIVAVSYSVSRWSYVMYTDPETDVVRAGWVSKRYLE